MRFLIFILLLASTAVAQEHLEPESSVFSESFSDDYYALVVDGFSDAFKRDVRARMIAIPSFTNEYAIGIRESFGEFRIFKLTPEYSYWVRYQDIDVESESKERSQQESEISSDIEITKCEETITPELATAIIAVWKDMLLGTRYKESNGAGMDGARYHFAMRLDVQVLAGQIWSPDKKSRSGRLVSLAMAMGKWCDDTSISNYGMLEEALADMRKVL